MGSSKKHNNKDPEQLPDLQPQEDSSSTSQNHEDVGETSVFYARPFKGEQDQETQEKSNRLPDPDALEFDLDTINSEPSNEGKFMAYGDMIVYQDELNYPGWEINEIDPPADNVSLTFEPREQSQLDAQIDDNVPKSDQELAQELEYLLNQFGPIEDNDENYPEMADPIDQSPNKDPDDNDELKTFLKSKLLSNPGDWPLHESEVLDQPVQGPERRVKKTKLDRTSSKIKDKDSSELPANERIFPAESSRSDTWAPKTEHESAGQNIRRKTWNKGAALLLLAVIGVILWLAGNNHYEARSDLLFVPEKMSGVQGIGWSLDSEASALKSSGLVYAFSETMFNGKVNNQQMSSPYIAEAYKANFKSEGKFIKWLSKNMSVIARSDEGFVSLSLTGDDPELLKRVLDNYVGFYSHYRPAIIEEHVSLGKLQDQVPGKINTPAVKTIENRLVKLNSQIQETQLALDMMKSGNGPFRGFLASDNAANIPSIASFQSKIVELELKKKELEVRYKKGSRELRSINEQMDGVRRAMMECVAERARFLKIKADQLEKTKKKMLANTSAGPGKRRTKKMRQKPVNAENLNIPLSQEKAPQIGDGLYLVETAHIVKIPAKERLRNLFNYLAGYTGASANQWSGSWKKTFTSYPFTSDVPGWERWEEAVAASAENRRQSSDTTGNEPSQNSHKGFRNIW